MKFFSLNQLPLYTDDFFIKPLDDVFKKDAIVIFNPTDAMVASPVLFHSRKTLDEHIAYIQSNRIKKAIVVAEDIQFLRQCPCLEYLWVLPSISAVNFDYSPLYDLPNLKWFQCETTYGLGTVADNEKTQVANIDYSRLPGLRRLTIIGAKGHLNVQDANNVRSLYFNCGFPNAKTLSHSVPGKELRNFSINQAPIQSLDGIQVASRLQRLELAFNRRLSDISHLRYLKESLVYLEIDRCGKIHDFAVLSELQNLEFLTLKGSNVLPDLSFIAKMPKLKNLHITMDVEDGDLTLCKGVPYVRIQNRKHFSHKNEELPKNYTDPEKLYPFNCI